MTTIRAIAVGLLLIGLVVVGWWGIVSAFTAMPGVSVVALLLLLFYIFNDPTDRWRNP